MNCGLGPAQPDWKAYALGEMDAKARREAEAHAATCVGCQEEMASLRVTLDAMATLRDEEMPRRIAFVSDKVFEPKWWQRWWNPTFASACVVAASILVHAFSGNGSQAQIDAAVYKAVATVEARHAEETARLAAYTEFVGKQVNQMYVSTNGLIRQ